MKFLFPRRLTGVITFFLGSILAADLCAAEPGGKPDAEPPKKIFAPEVEAKLAEFYRKLREAKRELWVIQIKEEIETMRKSVGLDGEAITALEAAAQPVAEVCLDPWIAKLDEMFRRDSGQMNQSPKEMVEMLDQVIAMVGNYVKEELPFDYLRPLEHARWTETIQRVLTAEQSAAWTRESDARRQAFENEVGEFIKPLAANARESKKTALLVRVSEIKRIVKLSEERVKEFTALINRMADEAGEESRKQIGKALRDMNAERRKQVLKSGNFHNNLNPESARKEQETWSEAVAKILAPEEQQHLRTAREAEVRRRARVLATMTVALLDEQLALTETQREKLHPLLEPLLQKQTGFFPEQSAFSGEQSVYIDLSPKAFFAAAVPVTEADLKAILDEFQYKRWQEVCTGAKEENTSRSTKKPKAAVPFSEPEEAEGAISDLLFVKAEEERKELLATMMLKARDAARVAALAPEAADRLQSAARGAVEEAMERWRTSINQNVRAMLSQVEPQHMAQRLNGIPEYLFQNGSNTAGEQTALWLKAVNRELNEEQGAAWKSEIARRTQYREKAAASLIIAEFSRRNALDAEQWQKLEPAIEKAVRDYDPDIASMFSSSNSVPWYLQAHMMFIPLIAFPEKELKTILTNEQWEQWTGSNEFSNASSYFTHIQQNHEQRVKEQKK